MNRIPRSRRIRFTSLACALGLAGVCLTTPARAAASPAEANRLAAAFKQPPMSARPMTWWHWVNGMITKEGITQDLEWMKSFGLGGAVVFNVGMLGDDLPRKVPYRSDAWWGMVDHAISEADRLGLKIGFHNCDGWSHSGGPWMTPEQSMKKLVWTEQFVAGGQGNIVLPQPETIRDYYRDVAILALPVSEKTAEITGARLSSNAAGFKAADLLDHNEATALELRNLKSGKPVHFDFQFDHPQTIATATLRTAGDRMVGFALTVAVSDDGVTYRPIKTFDSQTRGQLGWKTQGKGSSLSLSFAPQTTRHFRLTFDRCGRFELSDLALFATERLDLWEIKAGHLQYTEHGGSPETYVPDRARYGEAGVADSIPQRAQIDLTGKLGADGRLDWTAPAGQWRLLRIGYTTTGKTNGPSTVEGRGLEADKLDPAALDTHYDHFMKELLGREVNRRTDSLAYTEIDSWEAGVQNWTARMGGIFRELNGYDLKPFLPVLVGGYVVDNYEVSERFLWDFRKTVAHLIRQGVFQHMADRATRDGLVTFAEGSGRQQYLYDPINYQSTAPIPKGEFWIGSDSGANLMGRSGDAKMRPRIDCKVASSVAHIYGGQLAASESFTGGTLAWEFGPYDNKLLGDLAFTMGINAMVLHTSAHQPYTALQPGFTLGGAGSHFHRNNIVYQGSDAWPLYLARCQYLLQQGLFVGDVLCFTGEDVPNYLGYRNELSVPLPEGYDYDGCNAEILLEHARVEQGKIVLKSGTSYRVLLLPDTRTMSLALLTRIRDLVRAGAVVVGPRPERAPGLRDYPQQDQQVRAMAAEVWGACDGVAAKENRYGAGRVIWGRTFPEIFAALDVPPDFQLAEAPADARISYIHRRVGDSDVYFVANARPRVETIRARFRVQDKSPVLFRPDTGETEAVAHFQRHADSVEVPLSFDPTGSVFVIFTPGAARPSVTTVTGGSLPRLTYAPTGAVQAEFAAAGSYQVTFSDGRRRDLAVTLPQDIPLTGPWEIRFPATRVAAAQTLQSDLFSWPKSDNPAIRYFSGAVTYAKNFTVSAGSFARDQRLWLDLGDVQKVAAVRVNGRPCPDLWKPPFRADITALAQPGENHVEIVVRNTWTNRLIGDEQLPADMKFRRTLTEWPDWMEGQVERASLRQTFVISSFYNKNDPLIPAGLLGPVVIKTTRTLSLEAQP